MNKTLIKASVEKYQMDAQNKKNSELKKSEFLIRVGAATCGYASGAERIMNFLRFELDNRGHQNIEVQKTGCLGFCAEEPLVEVVGADGSSLVYSKVTEEKAKEIIARHIEEKQPIISGEMNTNFYKKQKRLALRNCGVINPEDITDYFYQDGYQSLARILAELTPQETVAEVKKSGLRGRGGGGFPTGLKWEFTAKNEADQRYVVCNADEGDPGAFMDRSILEGDPHSVLEAMVIAGYATGATHGYIYIRAEYPLAIKRLEIAIAQAKEYRLLGKDILGSGFDFEVEIKYGAGAFVCGEETALIHSIEGNRGEPTSKPPFPAESGVWGKPTTVNNVETLANIPLIFQKGADWFAEIGTEKAKGTKVFALAGKVNNVGLVEVPMGTTLREIIFDIGGGIRNGKKFKAVQTGGPSGGCIPEQYLDTPIEYESLAAIDSMMGSGGMIVLDEDDCMVNIAQFYLDFTVEESCGKCTPCRVGNKRLLEILNKITGGTGTPKDLLLLEDLGKIIKDTSLCGLGQSAPNPVLSTLKYFREEYEAHVNEGRCFAGVCSSLVQYRIIEEKCVGCTLCKKVCPVSCIDGTPKHVHSINSDRCIKCGVCYEKCKFDAIIKI